MPSEQPLYCISIFGLTKFFQGQELSIKKLAEKFIEDIKNIQPKGPYYLITYCADSYLTFEVAQQLQAQGEKIALLAFIDALWLNVKLNYSRHCYNWREFGFIYFLEKGKNNLQYFGKKIINKLKERQKEEEVLISYLEDVKLLKIYQEKRDNYQPQEYPGKITLFICRELFSFYSDERSKLPKLANQGVEVHKIPGYHHTVFKEPYIQILVEKLLNNCDFKY